MGKQEATEGSSSRSVEDILFCGPKLRGEGNSKKERKGEGEGLSITKTPEFT